MHTNETKDKFTELRLKGTSLADIAKIRKTGLFSNLIKLPKAKTDPQKRRY